METIRFGKTDLQITPIGFGAWAIGGGNWEYGWGEQDDQDSIDAIYKALDLGINWIDTAAAYGLGRSEAVIGRALKDMSEKPLVFTKCGIVWDDDSREIDFVLKAESIRREVENSLKRLQVEAIDLYQIHWPDPDVDVEEGWQTLADLKKEGKVKHIGVSNFSVEQLDRANSIAPVETLQPPYSLIKREIEAEILPYCEKNDIGVIVYSPMYSGMLTGKMTRERIENFPNDDWRKTDDEFQEPNLTKNLALQDLVVEVAEKYDTTAAATSVAWTLSHSAVTAAIVGARNPKQVEGFIAGATLQLDAADKAKLEQFSL